MARKRKPFHVYKRHNGVYYVRVPDRTSPSGYRHQSLGVTNERQAFQEAEKVAAGKGAGGNRTFDDAALEFARKHFPTLTVTSAQRYDTSYNAVQPHIGSLPLDDIGTAELSNFVASRRKGKVTERTIRRDLMFVSSVYTRAAEWEWTTRNPVADFMRMQGRRSPLKRKVSRQRYLSHAEEARLEKAAAEYIDLPGQPSQRHERQMAVAAVFISIDQGLRLGELTAAEHAHIDRGRGAHGEWFVPRHEGRSDDGEDDGPVKSEPRHIPVVERARRILDSLPVHGEAPWILWHGRGERYHQLRQAFGKMLAHAGIEGLTWHDLRRTCGCRLLQDRRWPIERVSQFLGHQNVQVTRDHYAFLNVEHLHEELQRDRT